MKFFLDATPRQRLGRLVTAVARIVVGAVGATVVQGLFYLVFGPLSDRSVSQVVAGPDLADAASLVDSSSRSWIAAATRRRSHLEAQEAIRQARTDAVMQEMIDRD